MRSVIELCSEEDVNSVFKNKVNKDFYVLYTSLWQETCEKISDLLEDWKDQEGEETLYVINSWDTPAAFASYSITVAPSLMHVSDGKISSVDIEYPKIYDFFSVEEITQEA
jgi:hypothetical protein